MAPNEALQEIIAILPDVEKFDEHISVITEAIASAGDSVEDWKKRYEDLEAVYKKRFIDAINSTATEIETDGEKKDVEEEEEISIDSLDFSADSE